MRDDKASIIAEGVADVLIRSISRVFELEYSASVAAEVRTEIERILLWAISRGVGRGGDHVKN